MKIIDLLNLIAMGEEVPKELWYQGRLYKYIKDNNIAYRYTFKSPMQTLGLISMVDDLNDEIGVIEEEKEIEIEKLKIDYDDGDIAIDGVYLISNHSEVLANKINEIIDVINDMRDRDENND